MQGVVMAYDPQTGEGLIVSDAAEREQFVMAADALEDSIFRSLRQGQRVVFDLNGRRQATNVRSGAEPDLAGPTARV